MQATAQTSVNQLNGGDPTKVELARMAPRLNDPTTSKYNAQLDRLATAALPLRGCNYALASVTDRGQQDTHPNPKYRFDMNIVEHCPDNVQFQRLIGVIATPGDRGHWRPARIIIER